MEKNLLRLFARITLATCLISKTATAQVDPHFSQYYLQPMTINPALTGAIEGDYRVSTVFRSQYTNTLSTKGLSGEITTNKNTNFGVNLVNESTSDKAYNYTNGYISMAYTGVRFGPNADHYLVMAMQCGFISRKFDVTKMQFGSQWASGLGYDAGTASGEAFTKPSISSFDAGAGIAYYDATPNQKLNFFGGVAAFHITRPDDPYLAGGDKARLDVRYSVHAGVRITASDLVSIVPTAIYMKEGDAEEKMFGAYLQLYAAESTDLMFGAYYRIGDAVAPFVGLYYKGLTVGISYDVDAAAGSVSASKGNALEVSISFVGKTRNGMATKAFYCPRF
jgi:type IX secretion system PorP/SprF family membrane protein